MPENPVDQLETIKKVGKDNAAKALTSLKKLQNNYPDFKKEEITGLITEMAYLNADYSQAIETTGAYLADGGYNYHICYFGGLSCIEENMEEACAAVKTTSSL